jgi:Transcriptional Coactivator p15 (PC4)
MTERVTLPQPIETGKFWKNRWRKNAIVVSLSTHQEINIVNVREHFVGSDGCMRPTTKGIAMSVRRLRELAKAINRAVAKAQELHLIDGQDEASDDGDEA